ncbi:hypothetical protein Taro_022641 [Colocasia esculenta]|uniref:Purple acid phosphatase n=1 Tax=Colocasia esculenta TaxID=4460 RepID=A0A843V8I3_COLES|nr:hypothetical protein [Colocasia esculenta]
MDVLKAAAAAAAAERDCSGQLRRHQRLRLLAGLLLLLLLLKGTVPGSCGVTSAFVRSSEQAVDMPVDADVFRVPAGYNAPQQVHITQGDHEGTGLIVSWVTQDEPGSSTVLYGTSAEELSRRAEGAVTTYQFYNYTSGYIHHCTLANLEYDTKYYYKVGIGHTVRQFWFTTPPKSGPDVPYTFGLIGDLGQSFDSNRTLAHYESNPRGQTVLFAGDLSYADNYPYHDNVRWDTWGRFIERSAAYQPWIWTAGNHEIDFDPDIGETVPFKPYTHRYPVPYQASGSTSPLWYSIKRASAYIIVLSSYSAYGKYTPQYKWLEKELPRVDRRETPWLILLMHAPWYNSYNYHYMEGESMRVMYEPWFVKYRVDVVFAGHVHAYERSVCVHIIHSSVTSHKPCVRTSASCTRLPFLPALLVYVISNWGGGSMLLTIDGVVCFFSHPSLPLQERISNIAYNIVNGVCTPVPDQSAPVYITIGDGGNLEGLATNMTQPQPGYSAFRESSFGHAVLDIKNRTHAYYIWHRNQDGDAVEADSMWFYNRFWYPVEESIASFSEQ